MNSQSDGPTTHVEPLQEHETVNDERLSESVLATVAGGDGETFTMGYGTPGGEPASELSPNQD